MKRGKVYLIGAGPGDPGLLTLKGFDALRRAQVVIYDALLNPRLLDWVSPAAQRIYVGKRGYERSTSQAAIHALLLRHARRGRIVARLKGGDPFVFGRGGEEAAVLASHRIPFEVIPGITAALGAAAYTGIPLTDRRWGSVATLVTGHEDADKDDASVDWSRLPPGGTLAVYMGLERLGLITQRLLRLGWPASTPAVAVQWATTARQRTIDGTLSTLAARTRQAGLQSPVLVLIGRVVTLRRRLRWFDTRPLFGKRIVVTRAAEQAAEFTHRLEEAGAEVLGFPTIQIMPPRSWRSADAAIRTISHYDWILFTSVNGVAAFFDRLRRLGGDIRDLKGLRLGAIGPKTSARLEALGLRVDAFHQEYRAEALAQVLGRVRGTKILIARAEVARDVLPKRLTTAGATVTIATVYRTLKAVSGARDVARRILAGETDVVTFTSSSTVDGFMKHFTARQRRRIFRRTRAAAIGPITAATLRHYGVRPAISARPFTTEALAQALVRYWT